MSNLKQSKRIVLFLLIFVSVIIICSPLHAASIWEKRKSGIQNITKPRKDTEPVETTKEVLETQDIGIIDPSEIFIPEQYGTIIETHKGTNNKLIVHIQDAHANYEGQINSANILKSLIEDFGLKLILDEGRISSRDFKYLRPRATQEEREGVANGLVKDASITGVDYLDLAFDHDTVIQGIEDKDVYDSQMDALWEIDKFKDLAGEYVDKMIAASDAVKPSIYNGGLLELDNKKKDYDSEQIDLIDYYAYLYEKAEEQGIPLYVFPNFSSLIEASDLEKKIDMLRVQDGSAKEEEMDLYAKYIELTRELNINELFKEEPLLEDAVQDVMAENSRQKKLLRVSKALSIIKNLLKIKVVPEEYGYFITNEKDFDPEFWSDFLKESSQELGLSLDIPSNYYVISDNLPKLKRFYRIAADREKVFLERTEKYMASEDVNLAALVAGGFHTPSLTRLLADVGYSYIVVSPKVTTETDDELYRQALKAEWLPEIEGGKR